MRYSVILTRSPDRDFDVFIKDMEYDWNKKDYTFRYVTQNPKKDLNVSTLIDLKDGVKFGKSDDKESYYVSYYFLLPESHPLFNYPLIDVNAFIFENNSARDVVREYLRPLYPENK